LVRGEWESFMRGRGSDLYRIREYMPEDSARHVDWKATAKSGSLKVREFAREDERKLCIVFDNPEPGIISADAYEKAVNLTASIAWHFSAQNGELSFVVPGHSCTQDVHEFLSTLAVIEPRKTPAAPETQPGSAGNWLGALNLSQSDEYHIIVTARPRGSVPTILWNCSYFVFVGGASHV
jgi:uncharacterized protein (DUF58 family)